MQRIVGRAWASNWSGFLQLLKTVLLDFAKNARILTLSGLSNRREDWSVRELWTIIARAEETPEQRARRGRQGHG